ncbi:kinesin-domain-containing protein [Mucor ambiguus]|uniref:Kinesin-like protein n=1 Tax=Mucor ambiguus TaxID=91626 RepID=A0A0C9MKY0_9FUNG|nr:kinesin-domain-containing protein [Mucor ambiguus]
MHSTPSTPTRSATPTRFTRSTTTSTVTANANIPSRTSPTRRQLKEVTEANRYINYDPEKEPIKAYLRIKPNADSQMIVEDPYIRVVDQVEVSMTPPENSNAYRTRHKASEKYRFTRVFSENTDQQTFYAETTLDLVKGALQGENALIFAYGVTNSGKTYTVMGKPPQNEHAGLLPRAMNTIFSSIKDNQSETKIKPVMHSLVQAYETSTDENRHILQGCNVQDDMLLTGEDSEVNVDTNYEYGIWVSFNEIYNEQVFDLLDTTKSTTATIARQKRSQLQLKYEQKTGNKYVADTTMVKVKSMAEADAVMRLGLQNRQVFSTLMNQASSRSHSIFTVYIVRCPVDKSNFVIEDPNYASLSKLSVVDLAGSERYRNTNSTGQRLKEAGNINKSLMVLGQCMEVLRLNQIKQDMGKSPTMVPFRHSKLTELFKGTFEGEGKAAIIVNVNPYDTGFDENNHVMKFAAVAKDVTTLRQTQTKLDLQNVQINAKRLRTGFQQLGEETSDEEDEAENDHFVNDLIALLDELREKASAWEDAEARASTIESNVKEQVARELEKMESMYLLALQRENEMMDIQLKNKEYSDIDLLSKLQERQTLVLEEVTNLKLKFEDYESTKNDLLAKIAKLEHENQKERDHSVYLQQQLDQRKQGIADEDEDEDDDDDRSMMKENDNPKDKDTFSSFLNLRRQLRKSIFKKEELCKDADIIMSQVEQFDGVTFKLAKETSMGRLLKSIALEEFEKDPFQIKNRAMRLLQRYAQLPKAVHDSPPKDAFSNMALEDPSTDIQGLRAENAKLKQRIKHLNNGQKRLKKAFEKTSTTITPTTSAMEQDDILMVEDDVVVNEADKSNDQQQHLAVVNEDFSSLKRQITGDSPFDEEGVEDDYESDLTEKLGQVKRQKRRRKLRAR